MAPFIIKQRLISPAIGQAALSFTPVMLTSALVAGPSSPSTVTNAAWVLQMKHVGGEGSSQDGQSLPVPAGDFKLFANCRSISTWDPLGWEEDLGSIALCSAAVPLPVGFCLL